MTTIERIRGVVQNARDNNVPVYELNTEDMDDLLDALEEGARPYKVYTAIVNQAGDNDPVVTVLENNLGADISWTKADDGQFLGSAENLFPQGKTMFFASQGNSAGSSGGVLWFFRATQDFCALQQWEITGAGYVNGLVDVCIEIRVYP